VRIRQIVFRLGGVLYPDLASSVLSFPGREAIGENNMVKIHDLAGLLVRGKISKNEFLEKVCGLREMHCSPKTMESHIIDVEMNPQMMTLLEELSSRFRLTLLVDYPGCWFRLSSGWNDVRIYFPEEESFNISEMGIKTEADFFPYLVEHAVVQPGESLLIDHDSSRTAAILRAGLDAGIFVTPARLRRDFGLWSILPLNEL